MAERQSTPPLATRLVAVAVGLCLLGLSVLVGAHLLDADTSTPDDVDRRRDLDIHLAPAGRCSQSGDASSVETAVCTLGRAQQRLLDLREQGGADADITVRFAPGRYEAEPFYWRVWARPGHTLRFAPDWWEPGEQPAAGADRPEFRGTGTTSDHWLSLVRPEAAAREPVGAVQFLHLDVTGHTNGIMVNGGMHLDGDPGEQATAVGPAVPEVVVDDVRLHGLGNRRRASGPRNESALALRNVATGTVVRCRFEDVANAAGEEQFAHAVYAMGSSSVVIEDNVFEYVSGDPIRLRNDNQDFVVSDNVFRRSGSRAMVSDWHLDREAARDRGSQWETPSQRPSMSGNDVGTGYSGGDVVAWRAYDGRE